MTDLIDAIDVERLAPGRYAGTVVAGWDFQTPNGGYLAAIAYTAMAREAALPMPAAFYCQYLVPGTHGAVTIEVETVRRGGAAHVLHATMVQNGKAMLTATAIMVDGAGEGFEHQAYLAPPVPGPDALPSYEAMAPDFDQWHAFWRKVEGKPVVWPEPGHDREAKWRTWMRLRDREDAQGAATAVARVLIFADLAPFFATMAAHRFPAPWFAPSLDLYVQFHALPTTEDWLLADATAPVARSGLVAGSTRLWTQHGELIATAGSQLLSRRNPFFSFQQAQLAETPA